MINIYDIVENRLNRFISNNLTIDINILKTHKFYLNDKIMSFYLMDENKIFDTYFCETCQNSLAMTIFQVNYISNEVKLLSCNELQIKQLLE